MKPPFSTRMEAPFPLLVITILTLARISRISHLTFRLAVSISLLKTYWSRTTMPPRKKAAKASQLEDSIEEEDHTIFCRYWISGVVGTIIVIYPTLKSGKNGGRMEVWPPFHFTMVISLVSFASHCNSREWDVHCKSWFFFYWMISSFNVVILFFEWWSHFYFIRKRIRAL